MNEIIGFLFCHFNFHCLARFNSFKLFKVLLFFMVVDRSSVLFCFVFGFVSFMCSVDLWIDTRVELSS